MGNYKAEFEALRKEVRELRAEVKHLRTMNERLVQAVSPTHMGEPVIYGPGTDGIPRVDYFVRMKDAMKTHAPTSDSEVKNEHKKNTD
jgi:hypothetical protein